MEGGITVRYALLAFGLVASVAGCTAAPSGGGGGPSPVPSAAQTVVVRDFEFSPATLEIPAGSTVTWRFDGPTAHSSTADAASAFKWDSGIKAAGTTFSQRFDSPGSFPYHCEPHPFMQGRIVVR